MYVKAYGILVNIKIKDSKNYRNLYFMLLLDAL